MSDARTWFASVIDNPRIGVYLVARGGFARAEARNQGFDPHLRTSRARTRLRLTPALLAVEFERHPPRAVERQLKMQFVDAAHRRQIVPASATGLGRSTPERATPASAHSRRTDRSLPGRSTIALR